MSEPTSQATLAGPGGGRPRRHPRLRGVAFALAACASVLLVGCGTGGGSVADKSPVGFEPSGSSSPTATASGAHSDDDGGKGDAAPPATIHFQPASATALNPTTPVTVNVTDGTLSAVAMTNPEGKAVEGTLSADRRSWTSAEVLGYGKRYEVQATAVNSAGVHTVSDSSFTTLTPGNLTMPYLNTTGGQALQNGATYGVGIVPVVRFDEPIGDKAAAEKALQVTTTPHVDGVWNWVSNREAHWRPQNYLASGTQVTVAAKVYGVEVGPGLYGEADKAVSFTIGQKRVSVADDTTHDVKVYFDDQLVRTMPTSMGRGGYVTGVGGKQISLWTMPGTYTVIGHANPVLMDSSTYGLPVTPTSGYKEYIYWATQISTDGIYLHELTSTIWAQGHTNVSHGCLNLNTENATWFFNNSQIGDVVEIKNTGGPGIQVWQNGDWSVPWEQWVKGSALA